MKFATLRKKIIFDISNYNILFLLFLISFFLRTYIIEKNLFFGPEQGIDLLAVKDIVVKHHFPLIGAKTDVIGIFHGPIYYYLASVPFILSHGNPLVIIFYFIFINCLTVFLIYTLAKELFNKNIALLSSLMFTFSFGSIVYSRWLSAHPLSIPLSCVFFLFLYRFLKGNDASLIWTLIIFGLIGQVEFLHFLFFGTILLVVFILYYKRFYTLGKSLYFLSGATLLLFSAGNYILFDLRHNFLITKSIFALLFNKTGYHISFQQSFILAWRIFLKSFTYFVFPNSHLFAFGILLLGFCLLVYQFKKNRDQVILIMLWLFSPLVLLVLLRHDVLDQYFVSISPATMIFFALLLDSIWKFKKPVALIFIVVILLGNIYFWIISIPSNKNIFFQSTQPEMRYSDEIKVIDSIYYMAERKPFSFQSYTIPYWMQQGWEYLFWQYGASEYGYVPIEEKASILFVIVQEDPSNKNFQLMWLNDTVSKWGKRLKEFRYGIFTVKMLITENS